MAAAGGVVYEIAEQPGLCRCSSIAQTADGGRSWSNPGLLIPRKGLMAKTRPLEPAAGRILVPLYDEAGFYPVVLAVEEPEAWAAGRSWSCLAEVDAGAGEYSYPSLLEDGGGRIHVSYTENRYRIKHFQFDLSWLEGHRLEQPLFTD